MTNPTYPTEVVEQVARARKIAHRRHLCYRGITAENDDREEHSPACNALTDDIASALAAVTAERDRLRDALVHAYPVKTQGD